ncbi:terpene cyclase/mutase family protein [Pradoshia sp.]
MVGSIHDYLQMKKRELEGMQDREGKWNFPFRGPIMTDCFMIAIIRSLGLDEPDLMSELVKKLLRTQQDNGSWKLYPDELDGNVSATVQAYASLLMTGEFTRKDEEMKRAERFMNQNGGPKKAHFMIKLFLAMNGMYAYPSYFSFPTSYFLLPPEFPFSMYHCSNYARVHLTPMIICMNKRYNVQHAVDQSYFHDKKGGWFREERSLTDSLIHYIKTLHLNPLHYRKMGYKAAEKLMIERIEDNGTLFSYASSTFYMIYGLLALGYPKDDPILLKAVEGLKSYAAQTPEGIHIQNSPSEVWDTALLSYALQTAGTEIKHPMVKGSIEYLLKKQQTKRGDWNVNAPNASPGGWGFSDSNHFNPDNDDTSAALRALTRSKELGNPYRQAWSRGTAYLKQMQNKDGGFGAFEKDAYDYLFAHLPIENAGDALIDDSTADLTGRVIEFLGNYAGQTFEDEEVKTAVKWLFLHQEPNGSWFGKWGICYVYGTWAAVTGLCAVGISPEHPAVQKALNWLESIQQEDGGFGESCKSAEERSYVPLGFSTPSQTAWALDALIAGGRGKSAAAARAARFLLDESRHHEEAAHYPTGMGLPGGFYIIYESYNYIFPLIAISRYANQAGTGFKDVR